MFVIIFFAVYNASRFAFPCYALIIKSNSILIFFLRLNLGYVHARSLVGTMFPVPRIMYAMASDGLLFDFLSKINSKTKTPFVATMICGVGAGKYKLFRYFARHDIIIIFLCFRRYSVDHIQSRPTRRHGVHRHAYIVHDSLRLRALAQVMHAITF